MKIGLWEEKITVSDGAGRSIVGIETDTQLSDSAVRKAVGGTINDMKRRQYLEAVGGTTIGVAAFSSVSTAKDTDMNGITIIGMGEPAQYELVVTGVLEKSTANGANKNGNDRIDGTTVTGEVGISKDSYAYTGAIESLEIEGHAHVVFGTDSSVGGGSGGSGSGDDSGVFASTNWPVLGSDFHADDDLSEVANYEDWLGREVHVNDEYVGSNDAEEYTANLDWLLGNPEQWARRSAGHRVCWDFKLKHLGTLEEGADGDLNHYFETFGQDLVDRGMADSYIRPAAEFDLGHTIHPETDTEAELFGEYLEQIARVMDGLDGGNFEMVWNPTTEIMWRSESYVEGTWPGAEYVDYVGLDIYDRNWRGPYDPENEPVTHEDHVDAWESGTKPDLEWTTEFASSHGDLPICLPEWGCWSRADSAHAGGDNPYFIGKMYEWMHANDVAWHVYFEGLDKHGLSQPETQFPDASAKFKELFG